MTASLICFTLHVLNRTQSLIAKLLAAPQAARPCPPALPGRPRQALRPNRGRQLRRRGQRAPGARASRRASDAGPSRRTPGTSPSRDRSGGGATTLVASQGDAGRAPPACPPAGGTLPCCRCTDQVCGRKTRSISPAREIVTASVHPASGGGPPWAPPPLFHQREPPRPLLFNQRG